MSKLPTDLSAAEIEEYKARNFEIFRQVLQLGESLDISKEGLRGVLSGMEKFLSDTDFSVKELLQIDKEKQQKELQ